MICRFGVSWAVEEPPGQQQAVLDVGEVRRDLKLADVVPAHVHAEPDDRIEDRHRLGQQIDDFAAGPRLGERVHLDEVQVVAGVLAADQPVQCQAHPLDVDVLAVVPHRAAHVHHDDRGALGRVAGAVDDDVLRFQPQRQFGSAAQHGVDQRLRNVHVRDRIAELVGLGLLQLDRPFAEDRPLVPAGAGRLQLAEDPLQQLALEQPVGLRSQLERAVFLGQPLAFGHLAQVILDASAAAPAAAPCRPARRTRPARPCR